MILRTPHRYSIFTVLLLSSAIPGNCQSTTDDANPSPASSFPTGTEISASTIPTGDGVPPNANDRRFCYFEDRTLVHSSLNMKPCPSRDGKHSMCCRLSVIGMNGRYEPELCRPDGLCQLPKSNELISNSIFREGCTDPTFRAPECLKVCDMWDKNARRFGQQIRVCDNGSYCCGYAGHTDTDRCCRENLGFNITFDDSLGYPVVTNMSDIIIDTTGSLSTGTGSFSLSTLSASTTAVPQKEDLGSSLSTGAILGIVATNILLVAIVIAIVWYLRRRKRIEKSEKTQYSQFHNSESAIYGGRVSHQDIIGAGYGLKAELDASPRPEDMAPRTPAISELGAESPISRPGTAGGVASARVHEMPGTELRASEIFELDGSTPTTENPVEDGLSIEKVRRRNTGSSSVSSTQSSSGASTPRIVVTSP